MCKSVSIFTPKAFSIRSAISADNAGVAVDQVGEGGAAHLPHRCRLAHRQPEFVENFVADERTRMRWGHPYFGGCVADQW